MSKPNNSDQPTEPVLDKTDVETLVEPLTPIAPAPQRAAALRERVLQHAHTPQPGAQPELLTIRAQEGWKTIAPGVEMKDLYTDDASHARSFLLRMQPGSSLPEHEHSGDEECVMIEGEASLGGILLRAGDYHMAPKGVPHGAVSTETGALLYVRAAQVDLDRLGL